MGVVPCWARPSPILFRFAGVKCFTQSTTSGSRDRLAATGCIPIEFALDELVRPVYHEGITEKGGGPVEMNSGSKHDEILREVIDC